MRESCMEAGETLHSRAPSLWELKPRQLSSLPPRAGASLLSQCSASLSWVLSLHVEGNIRDLGVSARKDWG